jgi:hypothetical protein
LVSEYFARSGRSDHKLKSKNVTKYPLMMGIKIWVEGKILAAVLLAETK